MKYSIHDFKIGDRVFFDMPHVNNHNLYWEVIDINKDNEWLQLEIKEMGANDVRFIDLKYIKYKE